MKHKDLTGRIFDKLTVLNYEKTDIKYYKGKIRNYFDIYKCKCICGNIVLRTDAVLLKNGRHDCGCISYKNGEKIRKKVKIGEKHNRLTILSDFLKNGRHFCKCKCDCGNEGIYDLNKVTSGWTKSCGCLQKEQAAKSSSTHKLSKKRIYKVYYGMKARCYNKNNNDFKKYGGKGIKICKEWMGDNGFINFYNWSLKNGYNELNNGKECSIDRIDVNGNYCPENCRWISLFKQGENREYHRFIEYNGEKHYIAEWERILNIKKGRLYTYLEHNSFENIYKKYSN